MKNDLTIISSFFEQLDAPSRPAEEFHGGFKPRPPGNFEEGSASCRILSMLREAGGFNTEQSIRAATGLSHSQASWVLFNLAEKGMIRKVQDTQKNVSFYRYCISREPS